MDEQTLSTPDGQAYRFEIDPFCKRRLVEGLDDIGLTLQPADENRAYEERHREEAPWLFAAGE